MMTALNRSVLVVLWLTLVLGADVAAQETTASSTEGALFLLLPVGAQGVSLGRAMTAMRGPESAFWNPAGLAAVDESRAVLFRGDHAVGTATALTVVGARPGVGTIGASYFLLDIGDQDLTDRDGNVLGTVSVRNHLGVLSAAARIVSGLDAGVNFKVVQFRLSCRGLCPDAGTTATTYALDAGFQFAPSGDVPLRFGAMVAHVGPRLQVLNAEQADPLPARVRVAAAYDLLSRIVERDDLRGWMTVEVQDRLRNPGNMSIFIGSELAAGTVDALYLRTGYVIGDLDQEDGARVGLGLRFQRFDLSIAKSLAVSTLTGETEPVHVTLSIVF
jgi:hypothetical protein